LLFCFVRFKWNLGVTKKKNKNNCAAEPKLFYHNLLKGASPFTMERKNNELDPGMRG